MHSFVDGFTWMFREHWIALKTPDPVLEKVTVPVGRVGVNEVSET